MGDRFLMNADDDIRSARTESDAPAQTVHCVSSLPQETMIPRQHCDSRVRTLTADVHHVTPALLLQNHPKAGFLLPFSRHQT